VAAITLIPLAVLEFGHVAPRSRPHDVYDATISHPVRPDTIPAWVAFLAPLGLWLLSAIAGEAGLRRAVNGSATATVAGVVYHTVDVVCAVFITALLTEATKLGVGWLRPYFLDACAPEIDPASGVQLDIGARGPGAPACTTASQRAARVSFPSGHTSVSTVTAAFTAVYLLWAAASGGGSGRTGAASSARCRDGRLSAALLAGLAHVSFAWGIGATRLNDFRHHPADVVGGFVLGGVVGCAFAARSILGRRVVAGAREEGEKGWGGGGGVCGDGGERLPSEVGAGVV
jgi:membrane-associated phospholipid phosphatase